MISAVKNWGLSIFSAVIIYVLFASFWFGSGFPTPWDVSILVPRVVCNTPVLDEQTPAVQKLGRYSRSEWPTPYFQKNGEFPGRKIKDTPVLVQFPNEIPKRGEPVSTSEYLNDIERREKQILKKLGFPLKDFKNMISKPKRERMDWLTNVVMNIRTSWLNPVGIIAFDTFYRGPNWFNTIDQRVTVRDYQFTIKITGSGKDKEIRVEIKRDMDGLGPPNFTWWKTWHPDRKPSWRDRKNLWE